MPVPDPERLDAISTRWTLLRQAHEGSAASSAEARNSLVLRYVPAVRRFVGGMVRNDQDADDLTQDIVARFLSGGFAGAAASRGRFRDFLKTAVANAVRDHWRRQKRRHGVDYDVAAVAGSEDSGEEDAWDAEWRARVLGLVWDAMQEQQLRQPGSHSYTLLKLRTEFPDDTSEQLADKFMGWTGAPLRADALRQKLRRARLQFVDLLVAELGRTMDQPSPEKIEEELVVLGLIDLVRDLLPQDRRQTKPGPGPGSP
jgi:RNA polymerase sigma factor (sigma-70 family)